MGIFDNLQDTDKVILYLAIEYCVQAWRSFPLKDINIDLLEK